MACGHKRRGVRAVILRWQAAEVHYGRGLARNGVQKHAERVEITP